MTLFEELGEVITAEMDRAHVPGVAVGVLHEGCEATAGFGVTSVEHPLPVTADTLFQIGSTTKTVTGTVIMRLVEAGLLDLDEPVRTYLPDLRLADEDTARRVTMRHLLTHTGGWVGDYFNDFGSGDDALARMVVQMAGLPQNSPPGTVFSYNNAGFYLAGRVIEVITGKPYEAVVQEWVFDPLDMAMSFFFPADVMTHRFVAGHLVEEETPTVARPWWIGRTGHPVGGIASTAKDQLRYARFHLGDGARLLTPESLRLMQSPQVTIGGVLDAVGLTWLLDSIGDVRIVKHGGATLGQLSAFVLVPECDFAITVLTNADRGSELHNETVKWALRAYLGLHEPDPVPRTLASDDLMRYAGTYSAALTDLVLTPHDGGLMINVVKKGGFPTPDSPPGPAVPPAPAVFYADDRILVTEGELKETRGAFLRDVSGNIEWLRFGLRVHAPQRG